MPMAIRELPQSDLEFQMFVLDELADGLIAEGRDVIKATIGITELPVPTDILNVFSQTQFDLDKTRLVYPQGLPELREAVADYYTTAFHMETQSDNVVINVGTSLLFRNLFQLLCQPGQEILLPKPYYCLYLLSAILAGAKLSFYDIDYTTKQVDMASFARGYDPDKTAVVVLNSPGNPIGNVLTRDEIREINNIVAGHSFIIHDEIYNNTVFYEQYATPLSYLDRYRDVHIVTNGFSKGFRMYTKRVGYAIVPDALIMPMRIVQQHTLLTSDPVSQFGMVEALKHLDAPKELMRLYRSRAEYAYTTLLGTGCNPIKSDGGFYIVLDCDDWIRKHDMDSSKVLARDILNQVYVSTVPGTDFGIPNGLRLSFCNARFNEGIDRLREYFH